MKAKNLKQWRQKVLKRNNYTCQDCGSSTGKFIAHHLKSAFCYPELKLKLDNGTTLCRRCHSKRKGFALKFLGMWNTRGYLARMPTREEARERQQFLERLAILPPKVRDSYSARLYKVRRKKGEFWVRIPSHWLDRECRRADISLSDFQCKYHPIWSYKSGLAYMKLERDGKEDNATIVSTVVSMPLWVLEQEAKGRNIDFKELLKKYQTVGYYGGHFPGIYYTFEETKEPAAPK